MNQKEIKIAKYIYDLSFYQELSLKELKQFFMQFICELISSKLQKKAID